MSRKVEELLKNMEMWGTPTAAHLRCYESAVMKVRMEKQRKYPLFFMK